MRIILTKLFLFVLLTTLCISCSKTPGHSIRIKNNYPATLLDVKINSKNYGEIAPSSTTKYQSVEKGKFTISGYTYNGQTLSGSGYVRGLGNHKWTVTITSSGGVEIEEDR